MGRKTVKSIKKKLFILLSPLLLLLLAGIAWFGMEAAIMSKAPDPAETAEKFLSSACSGDWGQAETILPGTAGPGNRIPAETDIGKAIEAAAPAACSYAFIGEGSFSGREYRRNVRFQVLSAEKLAKGLNAEINAVLARLVEQAALAEDIYDENREFRPGVVSAAFSEALRARLESPTDYTEETAATIEMRYEKGCWQLKNPEALYAALSVKPGDALADTLKAETTTELIYVPKRYKIEETALTGRAPDPACFGETTDPAVISALLERPEAKALIGEQALAWSPETALIPDTAIRYYLDETILAIVWQEEEAQAVGTFAEVFIADGSQLRRRIAGDEPFSFDFKTTTEFALETNAVLALGGDFYHHDRACGISVYQRNLIRFEPSSSDTCYINSAGDMLFSYRDQFSSQEEAQKFVEENDVLFSLCFGPVLIDNGQDVTPEYYQWGEINDTYARSALGMLGQRHYLSMNINCQKPGYYYLATLRQAADAMLEKGCVKAYTLDGGQTATTVFNCQLINPVQFGWEKPISDIIYFATARP